MGTGSRTGIVELGFSAHLEKALLDAGIETVGDVLATAPQTLIRVPGLGPGELAELRARLYAHASGSGTEWGFGGVGELPVGDVLRGESPEHTLEAMGIRTLGQLAGAPRRRLCEILGEDLADAVLATLWAYCAKHGIRPTELR